MPVKPLSILLADDDYEDLELLEDAIFDLDPAVEINKVNTGKEVVNYLSACPNHQLPGLIVLDYNMPEMNGVEVLTHLGNHSRYHSIPKVMFSTSNAAVHIKECLEKGASDYFVKPTSIKELKEMSEKMLELCLAG